MNAIPRIKSLSTDGISDTWIMGEYPLLRENISNWLKASPKINNFLSELNIKRSDIAIRNPPTLFPEGFAAAKSEALTRHIQVPLQSGLQSAGLRGTPGRPSTLRKSPSWSVSFKFREE